MMDRQRKKHADVPDATRTRGEYDVDYARFERLIIGVGAAAIVGTAALSLGANADPVELVAQLLLLAVLFGAVRWGVRGGTVAAVAAFVVYVAFKGIALAGSFSDPGLLGTLALRAAMYGLVGVLGGGACSRMKDMFARAHGARAIDDVSTAYTPRFIARLLDEAVATFQRYGLTFSVLVISVDGRATAGMGATEAVGVLRTTAVRIRKGLRLVDEVGRLPWGAFAIILPQTGRAGAQIAGDRLRADLREALRVDDAAITVRTLTTADDIDAIIALAAEADPGETEAD
jgi:GGDEF domain-containing protein